MFYILGYWVNLFLLRKAQLTIMEVSAFFIDKDINSLLKYVKM